MFTTSRQAYIDECMNEEDRRWGTGHRLEIVRRYQAVIGISHLATTYYEGYLGHLRKGYFEPVPLEWSTSGDNPLTARLPSSDFEDGAGIALPMPSPLYVLITIVFVQRSVSIGY
jgi:hypothetical protein